MPRQLRTYKLTVRVIAELYPPLTNERRWAFQNAITLSRGRPVIRPAAGFTGQIGVREIKVTRVAPAD